MDRVDLRRFFGEADQVGPVEVLKRSKRMLRGEVSGDGKENGMAVSDRAL